MMRTFILLAATVAFSFSVQAATPATVDADTAAALECTAMPAQNLNEIPGAASMIMSAKVVSAEGSMPEYCAVQGVIQPQIQFELRLPTKNWNGRYLQVGCGIFCGMVPITATSDALAQGFAVAAQNMGHVGHFGRDPVWGNVEKLRVDYGKRSTHVTSVVAKEIIGRYYGKLTAYSYFRGCSTGGREALGAAQHYPDDFDGIIGGDPALPGRLGALANNWDARILKTRDGKAVFTPEKLKALNAKVLARCDKLDGVEDGILADPRDCDFKPEMAACAANMDQPDCLTPKEVDAVRKLYNGPRNSKGQLLAPAFDPVGSELSWMNMNLDEVAAGYLRYLAFDKNPAPGYSHWDFDFDKDPEKTKKTAALYDPVAPGTAPDLKAFEKNGGKLIVYHGWMDAPVSSYGTVDYWAQVVKRQGGEEKVDDFFRLYMIPGMFHCRGGGVPDKFDFLGPIVAWVEKDEAPVRVVSRQIENDKVVRSRPLFPYPSYAKYTGQGDVNDEKNWEQAQPAKRHADEIEWVWGPRD